MRRIAIMPLVATLTTAQLAVRLLMTYGMHWLIWPWRRFKTDARPSNQTTQQLLPTIALMHGIHLACTMHCYGPLKCDLQVRVALALQQREFIGMRPCYNVGIFS
jgi:hypothetical protein